jgi:hypothetical protein
MATHLRKTSETGSNCKSPSYQWLQNALQLGGLIPARHPFSPYESLLLVPCLLMSMRRFKHPQNLDIKDTPSLTYSITHHLQYLRHPNLSIPAPAHDRNFFHARLRPSHISRVPWSWSPSESPSPPSQISAALGDAPASSLSGTWPAPTRPTRLPSRTCLRCSPAYQHTSCPQCTILFQTHPSRARTRTLS